MAEATSLSLRSNSAKTLGSVACRPLASSDSASTISMTIAGLPSSSPVSSNQRGAGSGMAPELWSADSSAHSWRRSVSMIDCPGGGSARTT